MATGKLKTANVNRRFSLNCQTLKPSELLDISVQRPPVAVQFESAHTQAHTHTIAHPTEIMACVLPAYAARAETCAASFQTASFQNGSAVQVVLQLCLSSKLLRLCTSKLSPMSKPLLLICYMGSRFRGEGLRILQRRGLRVGRALSAYRLFILVSLTVGICRPELTKSEA